MKTRIVPKRLSLSPDLFLLIIILLIWLISWFFPEVLSFKTFPWWGKMIFYVLTARAVIIIVSCVAFLVIYLETPDYIEDL